MFIISFFVVLTMNIDSLVLFEYFYENKDKREMMVNYAENIDVSSYEMDSSLTAFQKSDTINKHKASIIKDINSFELPIGWQGNEKQNLSSFSHWINKFIGLLITMILLTLGAPFWYEMMVKMLDWRNKIKNPKINAEINIGINMKIKTIFFKIETKFIFSGNFNFGANF